MRDKVSLILDERRRTLTALAACAVAIVTSPVSLAAGEAPGRVPTVTRLVKLFTEREDALAAAMSRGDTTALLQSLADDFELRTGARAASPVPRAEFIANAERIRPPARPAARMAVHELGNIAVVSFVQGDDARTAVFVVDVWRQQAADWKLAVRYASPAGTSDFAIPGAGPAGAETPKKY